MREEYDHTSSSYIEASGFTVDEVNELFTAFINQLVNSRTLSHFIQDVEKMANKHPKKTIRFLSLVLANTCLDRMKEEAIDKMKDILKDVVNKDCTEKLNCIKCKSKDTCFIKDFMHEAGEDD